MAGVSTYDAAKIDGWRGKHGAGYDEFRLWGDVALDEIAAQALGRKDFHRASVTEWRFEGDLRPWRAILKADFVLVVRFRDAHETVGVELANVVNKVQFHTRQVAEACIVDLNDGRIDWCRVKTAQLGDLRNRDGAAIGVRDLLRDVLPVRGQN